MSERGPVKVDFGFFVTLAVAARAYAATWLRLVAWAVFSLVTALLLCVLPFGLGLANWQRYGGETWQGLLAGTIAVLAMLVFKVLSTFVLTPAGCVILCDQALREERDGFGPSLGRAAAAVAEHAGSLVMLFFVYAFLLTLFLLPGLVLFYVVHEASPLGAVLALGGFFAIGCVFLLVTSLLALPALLLEEQGASRALLRSWALSTPHFGALTGLAVTFLLGLALLPLPFAALRWGVLASLVYQAVVLFLPALMVAAYHGLAGEDARLLGRG